METLHPMTRVHLHLRGPGIEVIDEEGSLYAGVAEVKTAMIAGARDILANDLLQGRPLDLRCRIDAEANQIIVASLAMKDALVILL
ncbi:MAG: hypothetical protein JWR59_2251 [Brevundimonas sp.]|nr:hypothetical protein [Brevundimonas sp.]